MARVCMCGCKQELVSQEKKADFVRKFSKGHCLKADNRERMQLQRRNRKQGKCRDCGQGH